MTLPPAQNPDEVFDLVNENDEVIGQSTRGEIHKNNRLHRAVHAIFFNDKGEILLQKRSKYKDSYPLAYTTSCSGHVDSGETYEQALIRECSEELGVKLSLPDFKFVGKLPASKETGYEFTKVYVANYSGEFNFPKNEIEALEWLNVDKFEKLTKDKPQLFTPSFIEVYSFYKDSLIV